MDSRDNLWQRANQAMPYFAAVAAILIVGGTAIAMLCGVAIDPPQDESCIQCAREWIGALSGWAAAAIAVYIGVVQLGPLIAQTKVQNTLWIASTNITLAEIQKQCRSLKDDILREAGVVAEPIAWSQGRTGLTHPDKTDLRSEFTDLCSSVEENISIAIIEWIRLQTPIQHHAELDAMRTEIVKRLGSVQVRLANVRTALPRMVVEYEGDVVIAAHDIDFGDQIREDPAASRFRKLRDEIDELRALASKLEDRSEALRTGTATN